MKKYILFFVTILILVACSGQNKVKNGSGWISLFDGKSLNGWKAGENPGTFSVENGSIKVAGSRSHLFYEGTAMNHNFKNFEFKVRVMTKPGSNSGIYFHTAFQQKGFPDKGYEVQVNNSHGDRIRTGSLYDIKDIGEVYVQDNVWFTEHIIVQGKKITVKINDRTVVEYTEPDNAKATKDHPGRLISSGTFALQGHDPKSIVYFKDFKVRILPD